MGLTLADLFSENGHSAGRNGAEMRRRVVLCYDYRDEAGHLLYQAVRFDPKGFAQRRPKVVNPRRDVDADWEWKRGERLIPYRLPELLAANPSELVFVPEGEKDVEALVRLGLVATTNAMGAGKWRKEYADFLKGRSVVVLPDNDDSGRSHAADVMDSLKGLAAAACLLPLPDLPEKGDVSDWLAAGGTKEQLLELARGAMTGEADGSGIPAIDPADVATIHDLIRAGSEVRWEWEGWIQRGVLNAIAAPGGTGKTRFCADLVKRVAKGDDWPDGQPMTLPRDALALWVVSDNHHDEMVTLARKFDIVDNLRLNAGKADPYGGVTLESADDYRQLEARVKAVRPAFVIIDTVGNATDKNLSKQEDAKAFYWPLQVLARKYRTSVLCLTHLNAAGQFLGRRVLEKVRVAIRMDQFEGEERRRLEVMKTNSRRPPALGVTMNDDGNEYDGNPPEPPADEGFRGKTIPSQVQEAIDWLRSLLSGGPQRVSNTRDRAQLKGVSTGSLYRAKEIMMVEEFSSEGYKWWRLPNSGQDL